MSHRKESPNDVSYKNLSQPALSTIKEYPLITLEENHASQLKNENLIQRVRNSSIFIADAETAVKEKINETRELLEWQAYLNCDKIPKPYEPQDIRKFFSKALQFENEDVEHTINWLLGVNERSILNQEVDSINMTKQFIQETRVDFGQQYDVRVDDAIAISRRIEDFLESPTKVLSERILIDVEEMKFLAYKQIKNYIDNLTYRILSSEDAYMKSIDVVTAEYSYQAKHFDIHLWTFKNLPIYLDPDDTPTKSISLNQINVDIVVPFSVLCENMVIRGLHCHFDHFSAHARYFDLPKSNGIEKSLKVCLQKEWEMQTKIQAEVKAEMIKQRKDYEEYLRLKAEEEELELKQRKQNEMNNKNQPKRDEPSKQPKKLPKEPPIIFPNIVPLVREDFLKYELLEYQQELNKFHPNSLELSPGEVNLRKYRILGGVYQLNSILKPQVTNFPKLIMAWYTSSKRTEYKNIRTELSTGDDISKFFQITFELPERFCYWDAPIPCLFQERISGKSETSKIEKSTRTLQISSPIIINDFNLHELFTKPLMYDFIEHSLPRTISSFKFPEDLRNEEEGKKTKSNFGRAKMTKEEKEIEKQLLTQRHMLSFEVQNCPERLFPVFQKVLPVVILPTYEQTEKKITHPYEHFSDLLSALELIKDSYRKTTFKDKNGNPVKISVDKYERNIKTSKKQRITSRFVVLQTGSKTSLEKSSSKELESEAGALKLDESTKVTENITADKEKAIKSRTSGRATLARNRLTQGVENEVIAKSEECVEDEEAIFAKWSTANILQTKFNANERKVTIWTDRLGTFGFAFNRYHHFPFQNWSMQPLKENPQEIELTIESAFAMFRIYITPDGYKVSVTDFTKLQKSRKIYFEIKEPESDIKIFKEKLQRNHLNIFPERDAAWYMTGYFSQKHLSAELHTYNCISLYATSLKFASSIWNKLSNRRTMVLKLGELRDLDSDLFLLRVTPGGVTFVEIEEVCSDLETIELKYTPTWRNLEWYPDLNHLILSTYNDANDKRLKDSNMIYFLKMLLEHIRPLSFS